MPTPTPTPTTTRTDLTFRSAETHCAAWLYSPAPDTVSGRLPPVIVMAHGLGAVKDMRLDAFATRFCTAGYACLVFDYRHFGESGGEPRQLLDIDKQLDDWRAAIGFARSLDSVDGRQLILWGSSFSGGHVLALSAEDSGVRAVMSQCPFTDGLASVLAVNPISSLQVTLLSLLDIAGSWFGAQPLLLNTASSPFTAGLMTAADAMPGYLALVPEQSSFVNKVAARIGLNILRYYPGRKVKDIHVPVLFCICQKDSVAPARQTRRYAQQARLGEILELDLGHFDIYSGPAFEQVVERQLAFLSRHIPLHNNC